MTVERVIKSFHGYQRHSNLKLAPTLAEENPGRLYT